MSLVFMGSSDARQRSRLRRVTSKSYTSIADQLRTSCASVAVYLLFSVEQVACIAASFSFKVVRA
jgi:hypothetical protein